MHSEIRLVQRPLYAPRNAEHFSIAEAERTLQFHRSFPEYHPTPLYSLKKLAQALGVADIRVKDESARFGLNAFKVLGGSYSIGRVLAKRLKLAPSELSYALLRDPATKEKLNGLCFITATDGNHGRGVAWTAARLGLRSVVYMPKGTTRERLDNIRALGSDASIQPLSYDDCVRLAREQAEKNGWILVQDTSCPGYEEIPTWIMQGYTTLGLEILEQYHAQSAAELPTHIFLQAGVGSMAGAMAAFFAQSMAASAPVITVVEPHSADCLLRTAAANDGRLHTATGDMQTIMAGLACGEVCALAWEQLSAFAENYVSIPDRIAAKGMRVLGNPLRGDPQIISGESGASTSGLAVELMSNDAYADIRNRLGLNRESRILLISTEGDTDRENYRRIVWDGWQPNL